MFEDGGKFRILQFVANFSLFDDELYVVVCLIHVFIVSMDTSVYIFGERTFSQDAEHPRTGYKTPLSLKEVTPRNLGSWHPGEGMLCLMGDPGKWKSVEFVS